ncbi:thioredoxin family protein [Kosmotoga sp.]|uniref:thioredoxin family protein n=1 Tax=Kosmotoga sp. TaxID=1955248 RepID=UPI0024AAA7C3|nr:thioredoxin family protein [Kosmotoga sp.]MDI3524465.1 hypothetical protein [Kosmotoga sp.]
MKIEIYGTGCPKCKQTEKIIRMAVEELEIDAEIVKIEDLMEIMARGISITPAIGIDGEIVLSGKIPSLEEAKKLLQR